LPARPLFPSVLIGGFECSSHRLACGRRLDMLAGTGHDRHAAADYARLVGRGIRTARDGVRWHLIEATPGRFDFASVRPMLRAAREAGVVVIWDVLHYGWPDHVDVWGEDFAGRFARLAGAFAEVLAAESDGVPWLAPVNEISFLSWSGGEVARLNPFGRSRGPELKAQLVKASLAAIRAVREVLPAARFVQAEPIFHVVAADDRPEEAGLAEAQRLSQFEAWDMLAGRLRPDLGGGPEYLDVLGVNYYPWNQWFYEGPNADGPTLGPDHPGRRPFRDMLRENADRYGRPLFVAETGTEGDDRAPWFAHVAGEVEAAILEGVDVAGLCLYPVVDFPGWDNDRDCKNGLWGRADEAGGRPTHDPLAVEVARHRPRLEAALRRANP